MIQRGAGRELGGSQQDDPALDGTTESQRWKELAAALKERLEQIHPI
ncbi:hypothetical protein [Paenibacillus sp. Marseille-P2973]|nr:hypothetical protein [Paenibacillus sp. Marseille-P2973]